MDALYINRSRKPQFLRRYGGVLTKDLVATYVQLRLERECRMENMVDAPAYERVMTTAVFDTLNSLGRRAADEPQGGVIAIQGALQDTFATQSDYWSLTSREAMQLFFRALQRHVFPESSFQSPNYSWAQIALAFEVTAKAAKEAAKRNKKERTQQFVDWGIFFLKNYGTERWVECKGGWEQLAKDAARQGLFELFTKWQAPSVPSLTSG